jgi:hypothetical protein
MMGATWRNLVATFGVCSSIAYQPAFGLAPLRGVDVLRESAKEGKGLLIGAETVAAIHANIRGLRISPNALATYQYASDVIEHIDLGQVFESKLPVKVGPNERLFSLTGRHVEERFVIDAPRQSLAELKPTEPFEFSTELRVLRNRNPLPEEELGYGLKPAVDANSGDLNHRILLGLTGGVLRLLSPANLELLRGERSHDEAVMDELAETLPDFNRLLTRLVDIRPSIVTEMAAGGKVSHLKTSVILRVEKLRPRYPALADYLERLLSIEIDAKIVQRLTSGKNVAVIDLHTKTRSLRVEYYTKDGKLVPFDDEKELSEAEAIDMATLQSLQTDSIASFDVSVLGLRIIAKDIVMRTSYRDSAIAVFDSRLTAIPTPKIEGRLLGILPGWAIDLTIPGTIEGYARTFCQGILRANRGQGTYAHLAVDTKGPKTRLAMKGGTEIIDNFFLGVGLRIVQSYVWPEPDVIEDGWKLLGAHVAALDKDLQRLLARTTPTKLVH